MRIGVSNFDPMRLEQALDFKLKTKAALANDMGASSSVIGSYLNGSRKPSPENFEKIVDVLELPKKFFLTPNELDGYNESLKQWRSLSSRKKADIKRGELIMSWLAEIHRTFNAVFDLPVFRMIEDIESWDIPSDISKITVDVVEDAAARVRECWGLGKLPIRNLLRAAEKAGIVVGRFNLNVPNLDAVSTFYKGRPYVLLNSFKESGCRTRFDLAHEIGHLVLHRHVSKEDISGANGKLIYKKLEQQAHWFAGALLLPADRFAADFWAPTFQCFVDMKEKWKVSIQAMIRRGLTLNLLTETQYNWLNIAISKKQARVVEPLDEKITPESIRLFPKCFERYEEEFGSQSMPDLLDGMPFSKEILVEILSLNVDEVERFVKGQSKGYENNLYLDFKRKIYDS